MPRTKVGCGSASDVHSTTSMARLLRGNLAWRWLQRDAFSAPHTCEFPPAADHDLYFEGVGDGTGEMEVACLPGRCRGRAAGGRAGCRRPLLATKAPSAPPAALPCRRTRMALILTTTMMARPIERTGALGRAGVRPAGLARLATLLALQSKACMLRPTMLMPWMQRGSALAGSTTPTWTPSQTSHCWAVAAATRVGRPGHPPGRGVAATRRLPAARHLSSG